MPCSDHGRHSIGCRDDEEHDRSHPEGPDLEPWVNRESSRLALRRPVLLFERTALRGERLSAHLPIHDAVRRTNDWEGDESICSCDRRRSIFRDDQAFRFSCLLTPPCALTMEESL